MNTNKSNYKWRRLSACLAALAVVAAVPLQAEKFDQSKKVNVEVDFTNPSKYRDIDLDSIGTDKGRQLVLNKVREVFKAEAVKALPEGYKFSVQVSDIDMAGEYEPELGPSFDVRIDREIYPPRISFSYTVSDTEGKVLAEGSERLIDMNYLFNPVRSMLQDSEVAYDVTTLVRDWFRGPLKKKVRVVS